MFILDSLLIGSLRFVLDKIVAAAEAESQDESGLREQLLEAQMRFELGEMSDVEFAETERGILVRLRELRADQPAGLTIQPGMKVTGVEATIADELTEHFTDSSLPCLPVSSSLPEKAVSARRHAQRRGP